MLSTASLVAFVAATDLARARAFYVDLLGLVPVSEDGFALVVTAGGATLRITSVAELSPQPFTVLGWTVTDIAATAAALDAAGVAAVRYAWADQDPSGVWTTPSGDRVLWFHDPDGNLLSLTQAA